MTRVSGSQAPQTVDPQMKAWEAERAKAVAMLNSVVNDPSPKAVEIRKNVSRTLANLEKKLGTTAPPPVAEEQPRPPPPPAGAAQAQAAWGSTPASNDGKEGRPTRSARLMSRPDWGMRNRTPAFERIFAKATAGETTLPPDAKNYVYVIVRGLFTQLYGPAYEGQGYMAGIYKHLKDDLALDVRDSGILTLGEVDFNAKHIAKKIKQIHDETGKQVVLIGHSKGGTDIHAALTEDGPLVKLMGADGAKAAVRGAISMQAPIAGTPIGFVPLPGLFGLNNAIRTEFMKKHNYMLEIPTISYRTDAAQVPTENGNDVLVGTNEQRIPGSMDVLEPGQGHGDTVFGPSEKNGQRVQALITTLLTQPNDDIPAAE